MENEKELKAIVEKVSSDGTIRAIASLEEEDRDGDIVSVNGIDLKNFKKNSPVLWMHNANLPAIGRVLKTWVEGKKLMMEMVFDKADVFAMEISRKLADGFLNAFSISFIAKELDKNVITKSELLEVSVVNIGANAEALMSREYKAFNVKVKEFETKGKLKAVVTKEINEDKEDRKDKKDKKDKETEQPVEEVKEPEEIKEPIEDNTEEIKPEIKPETKPEENEKKEDDKEQPKEKEETKEETKEEVKETEEVKVETTSTDVEVEVKEDTEEVVNDKDSEKEVTDVDIEDEKENKNEDNEKKKVEEQLKKIPTTEDTKNMVRNAIDSMNLTVEALKDVLANSDSKKGDKTVSPKTKVEEPAEKKKAVKKTKLAYRVLESLLQDLKQ